jgi:uncharacterized protein (DUF302 family)
MRFAYGLLATALFCSSAFAGNGLIQVKSAHDVATTADRLEKALGAKGMKIFARINHAAGATAAGMELAPTELVIFGNPKAGTPLMQCARSTGIDLPQKALIWQDDQGTTWFSYNDPQYLKGRHQIEGCDPVLGKVSTALSNFAAAATGE